MSRPKGSKNKPKTAAPKKDLEILFTQNEQIKSVLNNNWLKDGTPNPFFGKPLKDIKNGRHEK